jgi:hypothetical protein
MEGFNIETVIADFVKELRVFRPELDAILTENYATFDSAAELEYSKTVFQPLAMEFMKKNEDIFKEPRFFLRGVDFSIFWGELNSRNRESVWEFLRLGLVTSYLGGDWMQTVKDLWARYSGKKADDIDEILNDDKTKSGIEELYEYFKETRIFKLAMELMETLNPEQFGLDEIDWTDREKLLDMFKDMENNPLIQRAIKVVGDAVEAKIRSGNLRKEDLIHELTMLREKFKHSLGKIFQEGIFGEAPREAQRAEVLLGNSPDARRARMIARMQRKLNEKKR